MTRDAAGTSVLTFIGSDGAFHTINDQTVGFDDTLASVLAGDTEAATASALPLNAIVARLTAVDPAFGTDGDTVTRNGESLSARLSNLLLGYARTGDNAITAIGRFITRLDSNPSARSVSSLYDWIEANGLTVNSEGFIVAYKGVNNNGNGYVSVHSGTAFVDGVQHTGQIPNAVGSVVTMPRNKVQDDPSVACHTGLHVGSHSYASSFGRHLLTVTVDPADVVSVPTDCGAAKMRVCRYTVVAVNDAKAAYAHDTVVDDYDFDYADDDDECYCSACERFRS